MFQKYSHTNHMSWNPLRRKLCLSVETSIYFKFLLPAQPDGRALQDLYVAKEWWLARRPLLHEADHFQRVRHRCSYPCCGQQSRQSHPQWRSTQEVSGGDERRRPGGEGCQARRGRRYLRDARCCRPGGTNGRKWCSNAYSDVAQWSHIISFYSLFLIDQPYFYLGSFLDVKYGRDLNKLFVPSPMKKKFQEQCIAKTIFCLFQAPDLEDSVDYHFIAFVEKEGKIYELDGRKPGPMDCGKVEGSFLSVSRRKINELPRSNTQGFFASFFWHCYSIIASCIFII